MAGEHQDGFVHHPTTHTCRCGQPLWQIGQTNCLVCHACEETKWLA